jgi:hypothetical protein
MSKTKGFEVDFTLPDGQIISRHIHKLNDVKSMVEQYKIPSVTIHSTSSKWTGDLNQVSELNQWPLVPDRISDQEDDCPICNPKKKQ